MSNVKLPKRKLGIGHESKDGCHKLLKKAGGISCTKSAQTTNNSTVWRILRQQILTSCFSAHKINQLCDKSHFFRKFAEQPSCVVGPQNPKCRCRGCRQAVAWRFNDVKVSSDVIFGRFSALQLGTFPTFSRKHLPSMRSANISWLILVAKTRVMSNGRFSQNNEGAHFRNQMCHEYLVSCAD